MFPERVRMEVQIVQLLNLLQAGTLKTQAKDKKLNGVQQGAFCYTGFSPPERTEIQY